MLIFFASSLRFFRPRGKANEKKQFSEAIFQCNKLYIFCLTPNFLVGIFLRFAEDSLLGGGIHSSKLKFYSYIFFCTFAFTIFDSNETRRADIDRGRHTHYSHKVDGVAGNNKL